MVSPLRTRVALVVNHAARRGPGAAVVAEGLLRSVQHAAGGQLSVHPAADGAGLEAALDDALAQRPDLLVVGGGDGTVTRAASRLAGTDLALGLLPLGTANDVARTLEVPTSVPEAVDALITGEVVDIDLGRADGRAFLNVASVGLSVGVTERLRPALKRRLGPLAYPVATAAAYRTHQPFAARLDFPDGDHPSLALDSLLQVAVANGRHHGGGTLVSPTASIDDDLLDVYAIETGTVREHLAIARMLKHGTFVEHERVHHLTTRRLRLVTTPGLPVNLDGEIATHTPSTFTVERDAVRVVVPRGSAVAVLDGHAASRGA